LSTKSLFWLSLCLTGFSCHMALGQSWLTGYNYRKKIVIDQSRIKGNVNLPNFPFIISMTDPDLINLQYCDPKINDPRGLDISFCLGSQPAIPIAFQVDSYDPSTGKLICWVSLDLVSGANAASNILYLYYGSNVITDPFEASGTSVWSRDYDRLWHMNADLAGKNLRSANGRIGKEAWASPSIQTSNFIPGKIGQAVHFNGLSDVFFSTVDTNTTLSISAWIKPKSIGKAQVIVTNDSLGGYKLSLDATGYLIFDILNGNQKTTSKSPNVLSAGVWYHTTATYAKGQRRLFVNGTQVAGGTAAVSLIAGGRIRIGCSKIQDQWFEGEIDELRIQNVVRSVDWINTEYLNQSEPALAYSISPEEKNPVQSPIAYEFTGLANTPFWFEVTNWKLGKVPPASSNVTVKSNKELRVATGTQINKLVLETGAVLYAEGQLSINCETSIAAGAMVSLSAESQIQFKGNVLNNGKITGLGTLTIAGIQHLQTLSGTGTIGVSDFIVDLSDKAHVARLETEVQVGRYLKMMRGTLNANGKLSLLADAQNSAAVWPISDPANTAITGTVNVQHFIAGPFSAPSTARGWRLLSSPIFHISQSNQYLYQVKDIQERVFITGPSGTLNGFDPSVNNAGTIYTHNQALPGTLSQKYLGIPNIAVQIPLGRGIYVFSRGDRFMADAYAGQIQGPVFINPDAYKLGYKGFLFSGELVMNLENRNTGDPGDGFNLLGNPYAATIVWSKLAKVNTGPFVWTFNPQNSAYQVSDDPNFLIPSGTGFFVRLNKGYTRGSLTFTEQAKYTGSSSLAMAKIQSVQKQEPLTSRRLMMRLSKGALSDDYAVVYRSTGNNQITDADALKIGSGYLSISAITADNQRLAIEDRAEMIDADTINLAVQAWAEGSCKLTFMGLAALKAKVTLVDHVLNIRREITDINESYDFSLSTREVKAGEIKRFSVLLQQVSLPEIDGKKENWIIYPNPFTDFIYIRSENMAIQRPRLMIRNMMGETVFSMSSLSLVPGKVIETNTGQLGEGIYILSVLDQDTGKTMITRKLIKTTP
jgi:hypothetical protein